MVNYYIYELLSRMVSLIIFISLITWESIHKYTQPTQIDMNFENNLFFHILFLIFSSIS